MAKEITKEIKIEDLPSDKQLEVSTVAAVLPDALTDKSLEIGPNEELDVYYNKVSKEIAYLPVGDEVPDDPDKMRIGTIAGFDISIYKDIIVHSAEGQPDIYEIDDGQSNNYEAADRANYKALGYNIKRRFVDASIGNLNYVKTFLAQKYDDEKAFSAMTGMMIKEFGKDINPLVGPSS